jgi:hypothetical protein
VEVEGDGSMGEKGGKDISNLALRGGQKGEAGMDVGDGEKEGKDKGRMVEGDGYPAKKMKMKMGTVEVEGGDGDAMEI